MGRPAQAPVAHLGPPWRMPRHPRPSDDPRVETLLRWARSRDERLRERAFDALGALEESVPAKHTAPALALVVGAAYERVMGRGPRELHMGNGAIDLLGKLGESGAVELVRLRER